MSEIRAVFRATNPAAIRALRDAADTEQEAWHQALKDFITKADPEFGALRDIYVLTRFNGAQFATGFSQHAVSDEDCPREWAGRRLPIPPLWRIDNKDRLVPRRQGAEAKKLNSEFEQVARGPVLLRGRLLPGMPAEHFYGHSIYWPHVQFVDDAVYALWGADPQVQDEGATGPGRVVDPEQWEPLKLSAYYAAVGE